jgi:hypothetical protein
MDVPGAVHMCNNPYCRSCRIQTLSQWISIADPRYGAEYVAIAETFCREFLCPFLSELYRSFVSDSDGDSLRISLAQTDTEIFLLDILHLRFVRLAQGHFQTTSRATPAA